MAKFLTDLKAECITDGKWRLIKPLVFESDVAGTITVPAFFETDFASVPRIPVIYMLLGDTGIMASVVHDYLYRYATVSRKTADVVFKEALGVSGVAWWRRYPMYLGVRLFGGACYA